jgi:hypothetical protein
MPISFILIAVLLALLVAPFVKMGEERKFERDMDDILKGKKPKEPFSIDPDVILKILVWSFVILVLVLAVGAVMRSSA